MEQITATNGTKAATVTQQKMPQQKVKKPQWWKKRKEQKQKQKQKQKQATMKPTEENTTTSTTSKEVTVPPEPESVPKLSKSTHLPSEPSKSSNNEKNKNNDKNEKNTNKRKPRQRQRKTTPKTTITTTTTTTTTKTLSKPNTHLPIFAFKQDIVQAVRKNRVVIITGETGSGKSTQVPSYILDDCTSRLEKCKIVCTQPRRLAATSLAKRVAKERGTTVGGDVGFVIGGDSQAKGSRIAFATTGCLLEMFLHDNKLSKYSHVIMDEVHERDVDNDLLLNFMRTVLRENSETTLILMSATIDPRKFIDYFSEFEVDGQIPYIHVPSGCYDVAENYLDDCFHICPCEKEFKKKVLRISPKFELSDHLKQYSLQFILQKHTSHSKEHAYLVFLPGIDSIIWFAEALRMSQLGNELDIHILHSTVNMEDQEAALLPSPDHMRKIILATNVAESSITVPDVQVVIDFCFTKQMVYDPMTRCRSLNQVYISKASAKQRRGRAGRVKDGEVYRMVSKEYFDQLDDQASPQIQTESLEHTVLKILKMRWKSPEEVLSQCIDPPDISAIGVTYELLRELGAVEFDENSDDCHVTPIGDFLSSLPLSLHLGRLVLYGYAFGYLPECIIMASIISKQSPILSLRDYTVTSSHKRLEYAQGTESDIIAGLYAFNKWFRYKQKARNHHSETSFVQHKIWCMKHWLSKRWLEEIEHLILQIDQKLVRYDMCVHFRSDQGNSPYDPSREYSERDVTMLKVLLGAAMIENMQRVTWTKEGNHTFPKNFIKEHSIELINISLQEVDSIKQFYERFEGGIGPVEQVHVTSGKKQVNAFVQFKDDNETKAIDAVKMALRLKRKDFSKVVNQSQKNVKGKDSTELDVVDLAETFMMDIEDVAQDNHIPRKKSFLKATDFLPKDMLLEHDFKFEFVKAFKGISNLQLRQMHLPIQDVILSTSSVVFPLIVPPGTTEVSLVVLPAVLYGINFGSIYIASENTLLPRVAGIAELIMLLFAQDVKYITSDDKVVAQVSINRQDRTVNLSTGQEPNKDLLNIRQRLHQCFESLRVQRWGRKSRRRHTSCEELTDACLKLIENIESVVEVTKETKISKPSKKEKSAEAKLVKFIDITIPDGSHRQINGRNGRCLTKMSKESGAVLELVDFETVRIAYNTDKQLKKAEGLLKKAINNYHIVFVHPEEAYILLGNIKSDSVGFFKYKDSRNEERELFALYSPTPVQPDFALEQDFSVESLHHILAQQEEKLVKGCFLVYEHTHEHMLERFVSKMPDLSTKKDNDKEYRVQLSVGKQLFYPAAATRSKPKLELNDQTVVPVKQFKSFEIGTQHDIKTEFLSAFHPQDQILVKILDYLNQHAVKQEEKELVNIHFVDVKRRERVHGRMTINGKGKLKLAQLSLAQKNHMYMSIANMSGDGAAHGGGVHIDYRLKLVDKKMIPTQTQSKGKKCKREQWLSSIKWNRETNTILKAPNNGDFEIDIVRHTTLTKFVLGDNIISVSHVTTDVDVSVEIHVENMLVQDHLSRKNIRSSDDICRIIGSQLIPETVELFSQWRLHVDSEGYSQLVNSTRVDTQTDDVPSNEDVHE